MEEQIKQLNQIQIELMEVVEELLIKINTLEEELNSIKYVLKLI